MNTSTFIRWSGLAAILSGILSLLLGGDSIPDWLYLASTILTIVALIGIYLYLRAGAGVWGLLGFIVALLGNVLLFFIDDFTIGGGVYALRLILLAVGALQANRFAAWVPWMWIIAPVIGVPGLFLSSLADVLLLLGSIAFAAGFIGAGWHLWQKVK